MTQTLLSQFQTAYRNLDLFPLLEPDKIQRFRVEYGREVLVRLKSEVKASEADGKVIFAGHRGCGKSTLLKQFAVEMEADKFFVVFFSIADSIEMSDVSHVNILYSIGLQLLEAATLAKISVDADIQETLLGWTTTTRKETLGSEDKSEFAIDPGAIFKLFTAKLQQERTFRQELERTFEKRISELVRNLDRLAATIQIATNKSILIVIDDLDKLDLSIVEPIYRNNLKSLFSPAFRIVFTIPISAIQEPQVMGALTSEGVVRPHLFPVTKFYPREDVRKIDRQPIVNNIALFQAVIKLRFPDALLDPQTARKMALMSGGVMRELVRIGRECCTECMVQIEIAPDRTDVRIDDEILLRAIRNLRNDFARQIGGKYEQLEKVYETLKSLEGQEFIKLLHGLMVLLPSRRKTTE
ncbi:P-loop NTPase fold protein [Chamaesiphon sp. OTE_75_metabat_556]|uniref:P-loop NTPase fold protein n=1 Tax=Chamaesiphon sp. OTE_75_metabat_556 TaxID=2964692 RepID=UPI00286C1E57|nr:P-loop NTPase fold protein [Chamaesiphon sp. OTE_75_metabat_556]